MDGKSPALHRGRVSQLSLEVEVRAFHFSSAWSNPTFKNLYYSIYLEFLLLLFKLTHFLDLW